MNYFSQEVFCFLSHVGFQEVTDFHLFIWYSYHWTEVRLSKCLGDILPSYWGRISMALWTDRHSGNHYMTTFTVHTFNMRNVLPSFKVAILWSGSRVVLLNKIQCHFHCNHVPRLGMKVTFNFWSNLSFQRVIKVYEYWKTETIKNTPSQYFYLDRVFLLVLFSSVPLVSNIVWSKFWSCQVILFPRLR